jgi:aspartyl-tRNA(Asn)/glutamyl-tRNA(Gln) amidotransferase subunit C
MSKKIKIDNKLISDLSRLAKLKFDSKSAKNIKSELNIILGFIDSISQVDTNGVVPLVYMSDELNILRNDKITNVVSQQDALKNAPQKDSDYFKVPTVLKK